MRRRFSELSNRLFGRERSRREHLFAVSQPLDRVSLCAGLLISIMGGLYWFYGWTNWRLGLDFSVFLGG